MGERKRMPSARYFDATGLKFKNVLESPSFTIAWFLQTGT